MFQERRFDLGGLPLNYAEGSPSGPPIVFLHGASGHWQNLLPLLEPLAVSWHVYAPDLRGHGGSFHQPGGYRFDDFVADIESFLDDVVGETVVLFGYSLGGYIALSIAAQSPARVRTLVIADTPLYAELHPQAGPFNRAVADVVAQGQTVSAIERALADITLGEQDGATVRLGEIMDAALLHEWSMELVHVDPDVLRMWADGRMLSGYDAERLLGRVQCPTLLIQADPSRGGNMTERDVQRATAKIRDVTHVRLNGLSHSLHQENAEAVLEALTNYLLLQGA
jgi:pimeloyl-ACP methyl ester carboxylesterase